MTRSGSFFLAGPAGRIECLANPPDGSPQLAAAVCHPHPLFGGTMHNRVVHRMAKALASAGAQVVRFQFRGVGLSEGTHDGDRGETDNLGAVLDLLAADYPGLPLLVAGYSFGAWVGLRRGARDPRVTALIGVGLATTVHDFADALPAGKPTHLIQGSDDALGPAVTVATLGSRFAPPAEVVVVPGASHFFARAHEVGAVGDAIAAFAAGQRGVRAGM